MIRAPLSFVSSAIRKSPRWKAAFSAVCAGLLLGCHRSNSSPNESSESTKEGAGVTASRTAEDSLERNGDPASNLPVYEIKIGARELRALESNAYSDQTYPASFICNGAIYENVRVRSRGAWARSWPKKAFKIFFEKAHAFEGQHCLDLNSGWHDPAFIREPLAYYIYSACGVPASKAKMVRVNVNGQFHGVYIEVEQPDKAFLERNKLKGAAVYKANSHANAADERDLGAERAFAAHYEKETEKKTGAADLQEFCHELAGARNSSDFFARSVDLDKYINYLAATVLIQHWDGFNKNHFLVHDLKGTGKWFAVPWDLDRTLGDHWNWSFTEARLPILLGTQRSPGVTGWNRLEERFFSDPILRRRFCERLDELLRTEFTPEKLFPVIDRFEQELKTEARLDYARWPRQDSDFHGGVAQLKQFVNKRRAYLLAELPKLKK
jgi:spore coat protein H